MQKLLVYYTGFGALFGGGYLLYRGLYGTSGIILRFS